MFGGCKVGLQKYVRNRPQVSVFLFVRKFLSWEKFGGAIIYIVAGEMPQRGHEGNSGVVTQHAAVARYYDLPVISYMSAVLPEIEAIAQQRQDMYEFDVHPLLSPGAGTARCKAHMAYAAHTVMSKLVSWMWVQEEELLVGTPESESAEKCCDPEADSKRENSFGNRSQNCVSGKSPYAPCTRSCTTMLDNNSWLPPLLSYRPDYDLMLSDGCQGPTSTSYSAEGEDGPLFAESAFGDLAAWRFGDFDAKGRPGWIAMGGTAAGGDGNRTLSIPVTCTSNTSMMYAFVSALHTYQNAGKFEMWVTGAQSQLLQ